MPSIPNKVFFGTIDSFCLKEIIFPFASQVWARPERPLEIVFFNELMETEKESLKIKGVTSADSLAANAQDCSDVLMSLYRSGRLLLGPIIHQALDIIMRSAACRRYLACKYKAVYVDEYQDVSIRQHILFKNWHLLRI